MSKIILLAAQECNFPEKWVEETVRFGPRRVKNIRIPKRDKSKFRVVSRPSSELELLQRWLVNRFFKEIPIHDIAMAFRARCSILENAQKHAHSKYFVRVDFKDFFHSIRFDDVWKILERTFVAPNVILESESKTFIERICFNGNRRLPIGYISSPVLSNMVMIDFDRMLSELVGGNEGLLGKGILTRYADDLVFSTNKIGGCNEFVKIVEQLVSETKSPKLTINREKTIFSSREGGSAMVTGLRVCQDSHITVTRKYKDHVRLLLSLYSKEELDSDDIPKLRGHLAYVRHVAPAFFSNLCVKHVGSISTLLYNSSD